MQLKVVVFDSAVEGSFLTHYNFSAPLEDSTRLLPAPTRSQQLPDMLVRLSRAPVGSIACIRGRADRRRQRAGRSRSDMRLPAVRGRSFRNGEWAQGLVPGGGPMARSPRLIGRGRLEVLLGGDDIGGELAQLYGYVNRALPDAEL